MTLMTEFVWEVTQNPAKSVSEAKYLTKSTGKVTKFAVESNQMMGKPVLMI